MTGPEQPEQLKSRNEKPIFDCDDVQQLKQTTKGNSKGMLVYNTVSEESY